MKIFIVLLVLALSGCSGMTTVREYQPDASHADNKGMVTVYEVKTKGTSSHKYETPEGSKIETDSKQPGILDGFNVFKLGL